MMKQIKHLAFTILVSLSLLGIQTQLSQAADERRISIIQPDGVKKLMKVNFDQSLSELRTILTGRGVVITSGDRISTDMGEISPRDEANFKVSEVVTENVLSFKPQKLKPQKPSKLKSILKEKPEKQADASKHAQEAGFSIDHSSIQVSESLKEEISIAPTADMVSYTDLSLENRNFIFDNLKLKSALNLKGTNIEPSFRTSVTWEKHPDARLPTRDLTVNREFSLSKMTHELKKSNVTTATAGANFLGISVDVEYKSKDESLKRKEATEVYLLATYNVKKVELSIQKRFIKASPELEQEIRGVSEKQDIDSYKGLIDIFDDYGFCVPTKFVLGGLIYCEDTKKVTSTDEATKEATSFAGSLEASILWGSLSAGGGFANAKSSTDASISVKQSVNKLVTGGDIGLANDPARWISSMGPIRAWRVIEWGGFQPITEFLEPSLKKRCEKLIGSYYKHDRETISLQGLNQTYLECNKTIRAYHLTTEEERIYQRFIGGRLIYKPNASNDLGKVEISIASLANPLEGTFDLSRCGDTGNYLSIATGYRKGKKPENKEKIEIWFAPRFLIERELNTTAAHFKPIMSKWQQDAPVGMFWTWGSWDDMGWYNYLTSRSMDNLSKSNVFEVSRGACLAERAPDIVRGGGCWAAAPFHVHFVN